MLFFLFYDFYFGKEKSSSIFATTFAKAEWDSRDGGDP
jgi:hypothetical protein